MENSNNLERRVFERFSVELPVRFIDIYRYQEGEGKTVDISAKGIGMVTEQNLTPFTPVELWVDTPLQHQTFYARGEVVWSKPISENLWRIGLEFERADLMGVAQLLRLSKKTKN